MLRTTAIAAALLLTGSGVSLAKEYPIGKPQNRSGMEIAAVYLQPIEMEPAGYEGRAIPLNVSFGVREYERGVSAADLLSGADAAMYLNKSSRR